MAPSFDPIELFRFASRALMKLDGFFRSRAYVPREINFDVPILGNHDDHQPYDVHFRDVPEPTIHLRAGRVAWDPIVYAHDHFVIRTRHGHWEGFGTGQARLSYVVQGRVARGWLRLLRKVWRPDPRILIGQG